jgi:O-6-methylguanine DNA methyltransferase
MFSLAKRTSCDMFKLEAMNTNPDTACFKLPVHTAEGVFTAIYSRSGLAGIRFPRSDRRNLVFSSTIPREIKLWHGQISEALTQILSGRNPEALPPLDLSTGSEFQQEVWDALCKIRVGETRSYGDIAHAIGRPGAVRAVGSACGANPIPVIVPCHRVLAANQRLGGFSSGLHWKRKLLGLEGVRFHESQASTNLSKSLQSTGNFELFAPADSFVDH